MKHRCPVCHKIIKPFIQEQPGESKFFPFCSRRCKLIDLGAWLDAKYRIVAEPKSQKAEPSDAAPDVPADKQ
jgi:endogenous inhibitor of DNA gyrase (YacG/DUF329 family)